MKNKLENDLADVEGEKNRLEKLRQDIAHTQQKAVEKAHAAAIQLQARERELDAEHERLVAEKSELAKKAVSVRDKLRCLHLA